MVVQQNNYKEKIQQAKTAYDDGDYETAKFKAEEALGFMPESKEAQRIKEDSHRRIKSQKDLERYLVRTDSFIAQKAYKEASQELKKARLLDVDDKEIVERETKIAQEQHAANAHIEELTNSLNASLSKGQYDEALKFCNELIEVDFANSRRWSAKIAEINTKKERATEEKKRWDKLTRDINSALIADDWSKLFDLCKEALDIREDSDIRTKFQKAEEKLSEKRKEEQFAKTMSEINELAVRKEFDEANSQLNALERTLRQDGLLDSNKEKLIRETRKSLFDFNGGSNSTNRSAKDGNSTRKNGFPNEPEKSFQTKPKKPEVDPFDWDIGSSAKKVQKIVPETRQRLSDLNTGTGNQSSKSGSKPTGKITNDDFNF